MAIRINANFALIDDRLLMVVDEFYRVFDNDDVTIAIFIAMINQRRQRSGFS